MVEYIDYNSESWIGMGKDETQRAFEFNGYGDVGEDE
jgi:hypothetical protein